MNYNFRVELTKFEFNALMEASKFVGNKVLLDDVILKDIDEDIKFNMEISYEVETEVEYYESDTNYAECSSSVKLIDWSIYGILKGYEVNVELDYAFIENEIIEYIENNL